MPSSDERGYPCSNRACLYTSHAGPTCPYPRPAPPGRDWQAIQRLHRSQLEGRPLPPLEARNSYWQWVLALNLIAAVALGLVLLL